MSYLISKTANVSHFIQQFIYCFEMNDYDLYSTKQIKPRWM
jgi:hypothetical protein